MLLRSVALTSGTVTLLLLVACSGSSAAPIPSLLGSPEEDQSNIEPPAESDAGAIPHSGPDASDAGTDAAPSDGGTDAKSDASDAGPSRCETCLATDCKTVRDACMTDPTCKLLSACLDACSTNACRDACFVKYPDPTAKAKNGALYKCQCITSCATSCSLECR